MTQTLEELKQDLYNTFNRINRVAVSCLATAERGYGNSEAQASGIAAVNAGAATATAIAAVEAQIYARNEAPIKVLHAAPTPTRDPGLI